MAMNSRKLPPRLTALTLLLTAVALIPPERYGAWDRSRVPAAALANPFRQGQLILGRQLKRAKTGLYFAERATKALAAEPASGLSITVEPGFPSRFADYLVPRLREHWNELGARPDVRIAADLAIDTLRLYGSWQDGLRLQDPEGIGEPIRDPIRDTDWRIRPTFAPDGVSCVIAITVGQWRLDMVDDHTPWAEPAYVLRPRRSIDAPPGLGPCGFIATFGAPGRHVGAWLDSTAYTFARVADWSTRHPATPDSLQSLRAYQERWDVTVRGCSVGRLESCRAALLRPPWSEYVPRWLSRNNPEGWFGFDHREASFAEHAPFLLSDLVHDVGPEAFGRFWRSDLPLEEAFRQATGRGLVEWTAAWAREYIGPRPHSPRVGGLTLALSLLAAGLAAGFAAVVNQKR